MFLILHWAVTQPVICFLWDPIKAEGPRVLETGREDGETSWRPTPPPCAVYQVECKRTNSRSGEFGSQLSFKTAKVFAFQGLLTSNPQVATNISWDTEFDFICLLLSLCWFILKISGVRIKSRRGQFLEVVQPLIIILNHNIPSTNSNINNIHNFSRFQTRHIWP